MKICIFFFRHKDVALNRPQNSINVSFTCSEEPRASWGSLCVTSLYCSGLDPEPQPLRGACQAREGNAPSQSAGWSLRPGVLRGRLRSGGRACWHLSASGGGGSPWPCSAFLLGGWCSACIPGPTAALFIRTPVQLDESPPQGPPLNVIPSVKATSKPGPVLRYWGSGLQHEFWRGHNSTHSTSDRPM